MSFKPIFEFQTLGGVFLGVKTNSKIFGNQKNIGLFSTILRKCMLYVRKLQKIFYEFIAKLRWKTFLDDIKIHIYAYTKQIIKILTFWMIFDIFELLKP